MKIEVEIEDGLASRLMQALEQQGTTDEERLHKAARFAAAQAEFGRKRDAIMQKAEMQVEQARKEVNEFYGLV